MPLAREAPPSRISLMPKVGKEAFRIVIRSTEGNLVPALFVENPLNASAWEEEAVFSVLDARRPH